MVPVIRDVLAARARRIVSLSPGLACSVALQDRGHRRALSFGIGLGGCNAADATA